MSWLTLNDQVDFAGLGACCPDCPPGHPCPPALGQAEAAAGGGLVTGVFSLIDSSIGAGARFIPESKGMRRAREQQIELEQAKAATEQAKAARVGKTIVTGAVVLGGAVLLFSLLKKRRKK